MASPAPNNAVDEDYQLWDPSEKEDTRLGKKFVVRQTNEASVFKERVSKAVLISVCRGCSRSRGCGVHGQELQEQAKRHEAVSLSDSHSVAGSGDCDR